MRWLLQGRLFNCFAGKRMIPAQADFNLLSWSPWWLNSLMCPGYIVDVTLASVATAIIDHPQVYQAPLPNVESQSPAAKRHKKLFHSCTWYHGNRWEQKGNKNGWIPDYQPPPVTTLWHLATFALSIMSRFKNKLPPTMILPWLTSLHKWPKDQTSKMCKTTSQFNPCTSDNSSHHSS